MHMQLTGVFAALGNRDVSAAPGLGMRLGVLEYLLSRLTRSYVSSPGLSMRLIGKQTSLIAKPLTQESRELKSWLAKREYPLTKHTPQSNSPIVVCYTLLLGL